MIWEYRIEDSTQLDGEELGTLGSEGWELVSVICDPKYRTYTYFFKRESQVRFRDLLLENEHLRADVRRLQADALERR